jgi:protein-tyrosine phosphatase
MLGYIKSYINYNYGSRRGLFNHCKFAMHHKLGYFSKYLDIDWTRVERLVFVCHGNICRSPLAEAVALQRHGLPAESFGLDCRNGAPADPRAIQFATEIDIDLTKHSSRHINGYKPAASDLIVVMEPLHLTQLPVGIKEIAQVTLIGLWRQHSLAYVHDPFGSVPQHFDYCEQMVADATEGIASKWQSKRR